MRKKKIVKKEPRQVMLLRQEITVLMDKLDSALYNERYWKGKYEGVKEKMEETENQFIRVSERRSEERNAMWEEVQFLRDLVSMLVVPADKMQELERIQQQRMMDDRKY